MRSTSLASRPAQLVSSSLIPPRDREVPAKIGPAAAQLHEGLDEQPVLTLLGIVSRADVVRLMAREPGAGE